MNEDDIFAHNLYDLDDPNHIAVWWRKFKELEQKCLEQYVINNNPILSNVKKRQNNKKYSHIFLTINPPPQMLLLDFLKTIEKTLGTKKGPKLWIEGYLYVLEQRGENETEIGKGFHTHILIKIKDHKKKSEIDRELKNQWKHILDVDNYHIFNIKYIDNEEQKRKQKYMLTLKSDEAKHLKQKYDIIWRENNSLQKYYFLDYIIENEEELLNASKEQEH